MPLQRKEQMDSIIHRLSFLKSQISLSNTENLTDINIFSENFFRDLLNLTRSLKLENVNKVISNFPSIDLHDKENRIAIQVTSSSSKRKLDKTVKSFIANELYKEFDVLKILILSDKKKYQSNKIGAESVYQLDIKEDVWDINDIIANIRDKPLDEIKKISDFIKSEIEMGSISLSQTDLHTHSIELLKLRYKNTLKVVKTDGLNYIYFKKQEFGSDLHYYSFSIDTNEPLSSSKFIELKTKFDLIPDKDEPNYLLLVTRFGLSGEAERLQKGQGNIYHQNIWELENEVLNLTNYQEVLSNEFYLEGLNRYYVPARVTKASYCSETGKRTETKPFPLFEYINAWAADQSSRAPIAILGGYGAGKSSFSARIASHFASTALENPIARRAITIKLGDLTKAENLASLLGGMFTNKHIVPGFDNVKFHKLNQNGRFVIILDGFDEMKHSMSWNDFTFNIQELNKLVTPASKIMLLGRPSAFLSEAEHWSVLRGRKKTEDYVRKILGWPEYEELDLCDFSAPEKAIFIEKYIPIATQNLMNPEYPSDQSARVKEIVDLIGNDSNIYDKPVHLKILVEIASDPTIQLHEIKGRMQQWRLYRIFIDTLIDREMAKEARKDFSKKQRQEFLRDLCTWLWTSRAGATSFGLGDLPFDYGPEELRELLIGSILEKKSGDIYYFGHRSFPEFILAEQVVENIVLPNSHEINSNVMTDGVRDFISGSANIKFYRAALKSLSSARGSLSIGYLRFLADEFITHSKSESLASVSHPHLHCSHYSVWHPLIMLIEKEFEVNKTDRRNYYRKLEEILSVNCNTPNSLALAIKYLINTGRPDKSLNDHYNLMTRSLLVSLIQKMSEGKSECFRYPYAVSGTLSIFCLQILKVMVPNIKRSGEEYALDLNLQSLDDYLDAYLNSQGLGLKGFSPTTIKKIRKRNSVVGNAIIQKLGPLRPSVRMFFLNNTNFSKIESDDESSYKALQREAERESKAKSEAQTDFSYMDDFFDEEDYGEDLSALEEIDPNDEFDSL